MANAEMNSNGDRIRAQQLKMQFRSTRKGDDETIESYVEKLNSAADSLRAIGSPVSDQDLVWQLLAGLPPQYLPYKNYISSQIPLPDLQEACNLLHLTESLLQQQNANPTSSPLPNFQEASNSSGLQQQNANPPPPPPPTRSPFDFSKFCDVLTALGGVAPKALDMWSTLHTLSTTTMANTGNKTFRKMPTRNYHEVSSKLMAAAALASRSESSTSSSTTTIMANTGNKTFRKIPTGGSRNYDEVRLKLAAATALGSRK